MKPPKTKQVCPSVRDSIACELQGGHRGDHVAHVAGVKIETWNDAGELVASYPPCGGLCVASGRTCDRAESHGGSHRALGRASKVTMEERGVVYEWTGDGKRGATMLPIGNAVSQLIGNPAAKPPAKKATPKPAESDDEADGRWHCEALFVADGTERKCEARNEHNGPHYAWCKVKNAMVHDPAWVDVDADDAEDPLEDEIRSDEERDLARRMREDREKHARELEASDDEDEAADAAAVIAAVSGAPGERILGYRRHPAAAIWPMLRGARFDKLVESVRTNGLQQDIVLVTVDDETWILDGSNRGRACEVGKVKPRFTTYTGKTDIDSLMDYVDAANDHRRHLSKSVRALIAAEAAQLRQGQKQIGKSAGVSTQAQEAERRQISVRSVGHGAVVREHATARLREAVLEDRIPIDAAAQVARLPAAEQNEIAERALSKESELKSGHVRALVRQKERAAVVRRINSGLVAPVPFVAGGFRVIVIDPPWKYDNSDGHAGSRGHTPYEPMEIEKILELRTEIDHAAAEDAILACWITNHHVPFLGRVEEAWGWTHRTMRTWRKDNVGMGTWPRGETEHLVLMSRGSPVHTLNQLTTYFEAPAPSRDHSRKPSKPYDELAKHAPGPFLEMFAQASREGWTVWGAEVDKYTERRSA
jgi:N6-adenosine-specific RNA methylase IME4